MWFVMECDDVCVDVHLGVYVMVGDDFRDWKDTTVSEVRSVMGTIYTSLKDEEEKLGDYTRAGDMGT